VSPAQVKLARALVALPSWRWEVGMLARGSGYGRSGPWGTPWLTDLAERVTGGGPPHADNAYPDLTDAATGGVLLGMLPVVGTTVDWWDVLEGDTIVVYCRVCIGDGLYVGSTIGEACARALLALEGA